MAETVTVKGDKVQQLSKISDWFAERADEQGGKTVVFHKKDFPGSKTKWQFLTDLAKGRKMGYVEDDKLVVDASKGYTPSKLKRAADYFLIGNKGEELKTLKSNGYLDSRIHKQKTLSHGRNKPRAAPKPHDWASGLEERGFHRDDYGGMRTVQTSTKISPPPSPPLMRLKCTVEPSDEPVGGRRTRTRKNGKKLRTTRRR